MAAAPTLISRMDELESRVDALEKSFKAINGSVKPPKTSHSSLSSFVVMTPGTKTVNEEQKPDLIKISKTLIRLALLERNSGDTVDGAIDAVCKLVGDAACEWETGIIPISESSKAEAQKTTGNRKANELRNVFRHHGVFDQEWCTLIDFEQLRRTEGKSGELINAVKNVIDYRPDLEHAPIDQRLAELFIRVVEAQPSGKKPVKAGVRVGSKEPLLHTAIGRAFYVRLPDGVKARLMQPIPDANDGLPIPREDSTSDS